MTNMYEKPLILMRTGRTKHRNFTISFIHLGFSFPFLLVLYFRMLHGFASRKTCFQDSVLFLCDLRVFFALGGLSHTVLDKMSCSHSTHMIERKEPSTDQR